MGSSSLTARSGLISAGELECCGLAGLAGDEDEEDIDDSEHEFSIEVEQNKHKHLAEVLPDLQIIEGRT